MTTIVEPLATDMQGQKLAEKAISLVEQAQQLAIRDQTSYLQACEFLKGVATLRREIEEHHAPMKAKAYAAHREACAMESRKLEPVARAERLAKSAIATYDVEQRRLEEERDRLARIEAERIQDQLLEDAAVAAEAQGASAEEVATILQQPIAVPRVRTESGFERASDILMAQQWKAEVDDIKALCRAIGDGSAAPTLVAPNMTALNQMARALKLNFNVPGCRAYPVESVRVGRR